MRIVLLELNAVRCRHIPLWIKDHETRTSSALVDGADETTGPRRAVVASVIGRDMAIIVHGVFVHGGLG